MQFSLIGSRDSLSFLSDYPNKPQFMSPVVGPEDRTYLLKWETESYYPIQEYIVKYRPTEVSSRLEPRMYVEDLWNGSK